MKISSTATEWGFVRRFARFPQTRPALSCGVLVKKSRYLFLVFLIRRGRPAGATHELAGRTSRRLRIRWGAHRARIIGFDMSPGSYSLGEAAAKPNMIKVKCPKCGRSGQYRIDRLIEQYCPEITMPELRHELAQCPHVAI
jgi:hypothetical protein